MRIWLITGFLTVFSLNSSASTQPNGQNELQPVVFQADWFSNAQFAGFFWADAGGLYQEEGLALSFETFDFGIDFIGKVSSGEAAFGTAEAYILLDAVAKGADLVALGAVLQESPAGYIYLEESRIHSSADMKGKRIGIHAYAEALLPFFINEAGLESEDVEAIVVQHKIEALLDGSIDLHQGYAIDEMLRLKAMTDKTVDILLFEDLGMPMYSMVLYSSRAYVEANPDILERFMRASAIGWERALQSPEITSLLINSKYQDANVDGSLLAEQTQAIRPFVIVGEKPILSMTRDKWALMQATYLRSGLIDEPIDLDQFLYRPVDSSHED